VISYFYGSWKRSQNIALKDETNKRDSNYWNQRIFLLVVGLIALLLPVIRGLVGQNTIGSGGFEKSFEAYSGQAVRNLIVFFLFPFLISGIITVIKKQFPTRIFNNLVIIMVVLVLIVFILNK
jgi:hypothetical protein